MAAVGRPPKYQSREELQSAIDRFFLQCEEKEEPKTIMGLALALNLTRQGLLEYGNKEQFSDIVKKAKDTVVAEVEARLFGPNATGSIFWLKNNAGYRDKTEVDQNINHKINTMSDDEIKQRISELYAVTGISEPPGRITQKAEKEED